MDIDPYTRAMFGAHARHVAFNYVVQDQGFREGQAAAAIIGNTVFAEDMSFGGIKDGIHTLVLCDAIIRPRLVIASSHLRGMGLTGIATSSDGLASAETWIEKGKILINNMSPHG